MTGRGPVRIAAALRSDESHAAVVAAPILGLRFRQIREVN